jgi:hypothetical protein
MSPNLKDEKAAWTCPICKKNQENPKQHFEHMKENHSQWYKKFGEKN